MNQFRATTRSTDIVVPPDLLAAIRDRAGLTAADHVILGAKRAMARSAAANPHEYRQLLDNDPAAFNALITELTVGETYFLRESGQFDFMAREVLPDLRRRLGRDHLIRAWSAGCASGEEAYSLAIVGHQSACLPLRVLGTDIAESRLITGRKAEYGEWSLRGVPAEIVQRYFSRLDRRARVTADVRSAVEFRVLNLASPDWLAEGVRPGSMDLILCRNVLIYLDTATVASVARRLMESLAPGGWLFLGASDPALADFVDCEIVVTGAGIAYRRTGTVEQHPRRIPAEIAPVNPSPDRRKPLADFDYRLTATSHPEIPKAESTRTIDGGDSQAEPAPVRADVARLLERARQAYGSGDYAGAADAARELVAVDARTAAAWIILVRALANVGRHEEAGLACSTGLDTNRTSAELTYLHGMLLREGGKNAEALSALRCAVYLDRSFVVAHLAMGDVLSTLGDRDGARRAFRNAERLLETAPESQLIEGGDDLNAGRLLALTHMRIRLLAKGAVQ